MSERGDFMEEHLERKADMKTNKSSIRVTTLGLIRRNDDKILYPIEIKDYL